MICKYDYVFKLKYFFLVAYKKLNSLLCTNFNTSSQTSVNLGEVVFMFVLISNWRVVLPDT